MEHLESGITFDIEVTVHAGADSAKVRIANYHTNIVRIEKNGEILENIPVSGEEENNPVSYTHLDVYKRQEVRWQMKTRFFLRLIT